MAQVINIKGKILNVTDDTFALINAYENIFNALEKLRIEIKK